MEDDDLACACILTHYSRESLLHIKRSSSQKVAEVDDFIDLRTGGLMIEVQAVPQVDHPSQNTVVLRMPHGPLVWIEPTHITLKNVEKITYCNSRVYFENFVPLSP